MQPTASLVHSGVQRHGDSDHDERMYIPAALSDACAEHFCSRARYAWASIRSCVRPPNCPNTSIFARSGSRTPGCTLAATATASRGPRLFFSGDSLSIHADNSSLDAILRQIAAKTGMQIDGLGADERVFGSFGPGAPRDVLADLLNGTAYNLVLLGDLSNGAPRELILTPATHGGVTAPSPTPVQADEASNEPEVAEPPPPRDVPPPGTTPATRGYPVDRSRGENSAGTLRATAAYETAAAEHSSAGVTAAITKHADFPPSREGLDTRARARSTARVFRNME